MTSIPVHLQWLLHCVNNSTSALAVRPACLQWSYLLLSAFIIAGSLSVLLVDTQSSHSDMITGSQ